MNYLVTTPCGTVQGTAGRIPGTAAYKGIRYATAGRWEYPRQVTHWDGVYDATAYGSCCYQLRAFFPEEELAKKVFYYNEFRKGTSYTYRIAGSPYNLSLVSCLDTCDNLHQGRLT